MDARIAAVLLTEPDLSIGRSSNFRARWALRSRLHDVLREADDERRARRALDDRWRERPVARVRGEAADDQQIRIELFGEADDLVDGLARADVQSNAPIPIRIGHVIEAFLQLLRETFSARSDFVLARHDGYEVEVDRIVSKSLIDGMLEDDFGILRLVERDDDTVATLHDVHALRKCTARASLARAHFTHVRVVGTTRRRAVAIASPQSTHAP